MTTNSLELTPVEKAIDYCWRKAEETGNWKYACRQLDGMCVLARELGMWEEWDELMLVWRVASCRCYLRVLANLRGEEAA